MTIKLANALGVIILLSGCANNAQLDQMSSQLDNLSSQVQQLSAEVDQLKSQQMKNTDAINEAKASADSAASAVEKVNERIDNVVATYKK